MKIRRLADAAIVAALLLTSIPELDLPLTPDVLLDPAPLTAPAPDMAEDPASREP